ncbi:MAG TPA: molecular chaperone DnaJ [Caulobacteraceae bacterium]|nr:molecular chaperone DnaJ [Caulobacteraceae bacterium]
MPYIIVAAIAVAALVWMGRNPRVVLLYRRLPRTLLALAAAAGALVVGLRGLWMAAITLILVSLWLGAKPAPPSGKRPATPGGMSLSDARSVLGLAPGADRPAIEAAHRRLMLRAHPDLGGTSGLAAQLNAARDVLLNNL